MEKVSDGTLNSLGVFLCRSCGKVYESAIALAKHKLECEALYHTRTQSNASIATSLFYSPYHSHNSTTTNDWDEALNWLHSVRDLPPPPFRQSLLLKTEYQARTDYMNLFATTIEALGTAIRPAHAPRDASLPHFTATPFWILTSIFEQLILSPKPPDSTENINPLIQQHINMFTQGRIKELYLEAHFVDNTCLPTKAPRPRTAAQRNNHAQLAANVNSFGVCAKRLTSDTPVVPIHTDKHRPSYNLPSIDKLSPPTDTPRPGGPPIGKAPASVTTPAPTLPLPLPSPHKQLQITSSP